MRKGEKAKVRIQKKFAFGRPGEVDKLRFPRGYSLEEKDQERRAKLVSKGVIYELTLIDWIERTDMEANSLMYKQWVKKQSLRKEHELPNEQFDEVIFSAKIWQYDNKEKLIAESEIAEHENQIILKEIQKCEISMDQVKMLPLKKALVSMKREEVCRYTISKDFSEEWDDCGIKDFFADCEKYDESKDFEMEIELQKLIKVEDWYGEKSTMMRTLRKGKGRQPYTDSTIWFRMKIEVNGEEVFSNYPKSDKPIEE